MALAVRATFTGVSWSGLLWADFRLKHVLPRSNQRVRTAWIAPTKKVIRLPRQEIARIVRFAARSRLLAVLPDFPAA